MSLLFQWGREEPVEGEEGYLSHPKSCDNMKCSRDERVSFTDEVKKAVSSGKYDVIILNYANLDMVGHTGVFDAAVSAVETIDGCIGGGKSGLRTKRIIGNNSRSCNAEQMLDDSGGIQTAHTCDPCIYFLRYRCQLRNGILADIARHFLRSSELKNP